MDMPTPPFLPHFVAEFLSLCIFSWSYNTPGQILIVFLLVSQVQCEGSCQSSPLAHKLRPTFCVYSLAVCQSLLVLLSGMSTVSSPRVREHVGKGCGATGVPVGQLERSLGMTPQQPVDRLLDGVHDAVDRICVPFTPPESPVYRSPGLFLLPVM